MTTVLKYNGTLSITYEGGAQASERVAQPGDVVGFGNDTYAAALVLRGDHTVNAGSPTVPPTTYVPPATIDQRVAALEQGTSGQEVAFAYNDLNYTGGPGNASTPLVKGAFVTVPGISVTLQPAVRPYEVMAGCTVVYPGGTGWTAGDSFTAYLVDPNDASGDPYYGTDQRLATAGNHAPNPMPVAPHVVVAGAPLTLVLRVYAGITNAGANAAAVYNGAISRRAFRSWIKARIT